jgi:hypothetical protein
VPFGSRLGWAAGAGVLSRLVVTVLSPPVGGLSRPLPADSCRRRKRSRSFRRYRRGIRSFARANLVTVSHLVRHRTPRHQRMGLAEYTRERRHRETFCVRYRLWPRGAIRCRRYSGEPCTGNRNSFVSGGCPRYSANSAYGSLPAPERLDTRSSKQFPERLMRTGHRSGACTPKGAEFSSGIRRAAKTTAA